MSTKYSTEIMAVECPHCHAKMYERCKGPVGTGRLVRPHGARVRAANVE